MFDSITKYTIVENPHPPQGGVPLFYIILLYWLPSTFPRHPRAELLQWLSSSHGLADQLGGLRHLDAALTVTILHEPAVTGYVTGYSTVPRCSAECISKTDSPKTTICKICDPRDDSRWPKVFFFKDDVTKDTFTGMTTIMIHWWSSPKACDVCRVFWWEYHSGNQWLKWLNGFKYAASTWNGWKTQKYT